MKLKNRNESPVFGFFYNDPNLNRPISTDGSFAKLIRTIYGLYAANGITVPGNIEQLVEDQICSRQPPGKCYYTSGLGDKVSKVIHSVVETIDSVLKTDIAPRVRRCGGCSRRRVDLNSR